VVLSHAFFGKKWAQRELDGLTARETTEGGRVVLPIWHGVTKEEILGFSPPLAGVFAADSAKGLDDVARCVLDVVRPRGSPLVIARDELVRRGVHPPVVTDEWWLDVVEASNREPCAGLVSQRQHWGRWTFPLPSDDPTPEERGVRLAWTALQMAWEEAAHFDSICQVTEPQVVLDFIASKTGLAEMCHEYPSYLATYAPQLTIRGFGGDFESDFDRLLVESMAEHQGQRDRKERSGSGLTTDHLPPGCDEEIALRHEHLGYYQPSSLACQFVQGDIGGPDPKLFETIDYVFWLLSDQSSWLPDTIRAVLVHGTKDWPVWPWYGQATEIETEFDVKVHEHRGALFDEFADWNATRDARHTFQPSVNALADIEGRALASIQMLGLPEPGPVLADRFIHAGYIEAYLASRAKQANS
jgi:hypothetical protein